MTKQHKPLLLAVVWSLVIVSFFTYLNYRIYQSYMQDVNTMILTLVEQYNIDPQEIVQYRQNPSNNKDLFLKYGLVFEEDSFVTTNVTTLYFLNTIGLVIVLCILFVIYHQQNKKTTKRVVELTNYVHQINRKNYQLKIEDNKDDELSFLQNEIYKTMIQLNEITNHSIEDKKQVKQNLEDIAHQIKTPLTALSIHLTNIIENPDIGVELRCKIMQQMNREVQKINFLIIQLLKLSNFDANTVVFNKQTCTMDELVIQSIKNIETTIELNQIEVEIVGDISCKVQVDPSWQIEAITNILKNACEHGSTSVTLFIDSNAVYTSLRIWDNGVGFSSKEQLKVFDRFYSSNQKSSFGIGLALAKSIIEKDNGSITAVSNGKDDTSFTIKYFKD